VTNLIKVGRFLWTDTLSRLDRTGTNRFCGSNRNLEAVRWTCWSVYDRSFDGHEQSMTGQESFVCSCTDQTSCRQFKPVVGRSISDCSNRPLLSSWVWSIPLGDRSFWIFLNEQFQKNKNRPSLNLINLLQIMAHCKVLKIKVKGCW